MVLKPSAAVGVAADDPSLVVVVVMVVVAAGVGASKMRALEVFFWRRE
jgi:L-asparaginase/Glu-tRNA(Gln) amidotransferase subunit D